MEALEVVISSAVLLAKVVDVCSVVTSSLVVEVSLAVVDVLVEASSFVVVDICSLEVATETCVPVVLADASWSRSPVVVIEICSVEDGCSPVLAGPDACSPVLVDVAELIVLSGTQLDLSPWLPGGQELTHTPPLLKNEMSHAIHPVALHSIQLTPQSKYIKISNRFFF